MEIRMSTTICMLHLRGVSSVPRPYTALPRLPSWSTCSAGRAALPNRLRVACGDLVRVRYGRPCRLGAVPHSASLPIPGGAH